jgi:hypothetical protein
MTAIQFRRAVDAEIARLRAAHVITVVAIVTDVVVGVTLFIDNNLHEFSTRVSSMDERESAFESVLTDLRVLRIDLVPRRRPTPRLHIPIERAGGEPTWLAIVLAAAVVVTAAILGWCLV